MKLIFQTCFIFGGLALAASYSGVATADSSVLSAPITQDSSVQNSNPQRPTPSLSLSDSQPSIWTKIGEKAALTYFGVYRGASVGNPGNSLQPDPSGNLDPTSPQSIESYLTAGYKINPDWMVGIGVHFFYFPVGNPAGSPQSLQMWDPSLVLARPEIIHTGNLKVNAKLFCQLPMTSVDILQKDNLSTMIQPTLIGNYEIPKTELTIGFYTYIGGYIPNSTSLPDARTYKIYFAPTANYQLTKSLSATLWVDLIQITRNRGSGFISGMTNQPADIEPGIAWDITKSITFNPILNIYPSTPTLAATSLQAMIIARAF